MKLKSFDRIKEVTTSVGTGVITVGSTYAGHKAFADRLSVGDTCYVSIYDPVTFDQEVSLVEYTDINELTRKLCLNSSNSDDFVNFQTGSKIVSLVDPASSAL